MGFFEKLKQGLAKTKTAIFGKIDSLFKSFRRVFPLHFIKNTLPFQNGRANGQIVLAPRKIRLLDGKKLI